MKKNYFIPTTKFVYVSGNIMDEGVNKTSGDVKHFTEEPLF